MKKYLLGLAGLALTLVTLSSFRTSDPPEQKTELIWFQVDEFGVVQNPTTGKKGVEPPIGLDCEEIGLVFCSFGYLEANTTPGSGGNYTIHPESGTFNHLEDRVDDRMKSE